MLAGVAAGAAPGAAAEAYMIQLASLNSEQRAHREWTRLQKAYAALLGDMALTVQRVDLGGRGTFYRMRTGPFPNRATAEDMCWQLRAVKLDCLVVTR